MADQTHPYDSISDDLFDWMQGEVDYYVDALRGGYRSPFSAEVNEKEKMDYYRRQMYQTLPDGTVQYDKPNQAGRDQIMKNLGVTGYTQIMQAVTPPKPKGLRAVPPPEPASDPMAASMPPMPEDTAPVMPEVPMPGPEQI